MMIRAPIEHFLEALHDRRPIDMREEERDLKDSGLRLLILFKIAAEKGRLSCSTPGNVNHFRLCCVEHVLLRTRLLSRTCNTGSRLYLGSALKGLPLYFST